MSSLFDVPTQIGLEISPDVHLEAWQFSQSFSSHTARWNAYLNQICQQTFLTWLTAEEDPVATIAWSREMATSFWEVVNGTVFTSGEKRLILLPDKSLDTSELRVPQEWIDIPDLAADYYLAVQINLDEMWLQIWGYTTHEQLKMRGTYDPHDRTYRLASEFLIPDLNVLWVVQQLQPNELTQAEIAPLPELSPTQAENLLQRLAVSTIDQPRLEIPFQLWGALLTNDHWRQQLCYLRQGITPKESLIQAAVNLGQWFQNRFAEGWQAVENLLNPEELAVNLRQTTELSQAIRRVKAIELADQVLLLLVTLVSEEDGRVEVRPQLRPRDRDLQLPPNLTLALLSTTGKTVQSVESRDQDDSIQLRRFKCSPGTQFSLQVQLNGKVVLTEDFEL
jgi:hypothetical protein